MSRHEPTDGRVLAGLVLVALGIVFLADEYGALPGEEWPFILIALGVAFFGDAAYRFSREGNGSRARSRAFTGAILAGIGVLFAAGASVAWPVILIAVGVLILVRGVLDRPRAA